MHDSWCDVQMEMKAAYALLKDLYVSFSSLDKEDGIPSADNLGRFVNGIPVEWKRLRDWFQSLKDTRKDSKFRQYIARPSTIKVGISFMHTGQYMPCALRPRLRLEDLNETWHAPCCGWRAGVQETLCVQICVELHKGPRLSVGSQIWRRQYSRPHHCPGKKAPLPPLSEQGKAHNASMDFKRSATDL